VTVLLPGAVLEWSSHGAFLDNIGPSNPSPTAPQFAVFLLREFVVTQGGAALLAALFVVRARDWREPRLRLIVTYWLTSLISVAGIVKVGANHNYWIEFAAPTAVLATLGISRGLGPTTQGPSAVTSMLPIWLFAGVLGILTPARLFVRRDEALIPASWTLRLDQLAELRAENGEFTSLVREVQLQRGPGEVLAESLDIVVLADRAPLFEPFAYSMLEEEGRWNSQPLVDDICTGK